MRRPILRKMLGAFVLLPILTACDSDRSKGFASSPSEPSASQGNGEPRNVADPTNARPAAGKGPDWLPSRIESEDPRLRTLGIPTPAQAQHYRSMPDAELSSRASAGDLLAKSILVERLAFTTRQLQQQRTAGQLAAQDEGRLVNSISQMHEQMSALTREPSNAMAGYLYGQMISASTHGTPLEPIIAGIRLAGDRGDPRAPELEQQFMAQHPGLDPDRIDMYYEYGRQRFNPPPKP